MALLTSLVEEVAESLPLECFLQVFLLSTYAFFVGLLQSTNLSMLACVYMYAFFSAGAVG